jgi:WD40 repeat protein
MNQTTSKSEIENKNGFVQQFAGDVGKDLATAVSFDINSESSTVFMRFKLDLSLSGLISSLLSAMWGVAKAAYIEKYKNDFHSQDTVEMLKDEIKKIHEKLDTLLTADLKVAGSKFQKANKLLGLGDDQEASITYGKAEDSADEAIARVQKIDQLVQAYKIKLTSEYMRILISCKSLALEEDKLSKIKNFCITSSEALTELHAKPKIISAVESHLHPPLFGSKSERELLLSELWALDYWILSIAKKCNPSFLPIISQKLIISTKKSQLDPLRFMDLLKQSCLTLNGHIKSVISVCSSGDKIISGSMDKTLRVWDSNTGECIHTLIGHTACVNSVCILGDRIISGSSDKTIRIWDINSGECLHTLTGHTRKVNCVCVSGDKIISGSDDKSVRVWDINTAQWVHTLTGHKARVSSVSISGDRIISGSLDKTIRVWDMNSGECLHILKGHTSKVSSIYLSSKDKIVSSGDDKTIRVWDINTAKCLHTIKGHTAGVRSVCISGERIISGSDDKTMRVWDINTGQCLHTFKGFTARISSVCCSPGDKIINGSQDKTVQIWDAFLLL